MSLDGIADSVDSLECSTDGNVRIKLADDVTVGSLTAMYPTGAILVISRELFGECLLSEPATSLPDESEEDRLIRGLNREAPLLEDAFLVVQSVSGNPRDAVISGQETSFFAMFEEGSIQILLQEGAAPNQSSRINQSSGSGLRATSAVTPFSPISRQTGFTLSGDVFTFGPLKVKASGSVASKGGFKSFNADWGRFSVNVELKIINEIEASVKLDLDIGVGVSGGTEVRELLSVPLYGIPSINFLAGLDTGKFELIKFKLGFYFEIPLVVTYGLDVEKTLSNIAEAKASTSRSEITLFMRGPYTNLDFGTETKTLAPGDRSFDYIPSFNFDASAKVSVQLFVGVRPQVAAYFPLFTSRVSVEAGVEVKGEAMISADGKSAFPPVTSGLRIGICETCHLIQFSGVGKLGNAKSFSKIGLRITVSTILYDVVIDLEKTLETSLLPGNPSLAIDLAKGCFVEQYPEDRNILCGGDKCCDKEEEVCDSAANPPQCSGSPSPSPTPTRTPTPTPTQSPSPTPSPGTDSSVYTDPHLRTFDGLSFDCQGIGEFTMVKSDSLNFEVQARFRGPNTQGTVTKGIAVQYKNKKTVQVSIRFNQTSPSVDILSCPVLMYVGGMAIDITDGTGEEDGIQVAVSTTGSVLITIPNGATISFRVRTSSVFGCYFEFLRTFLPSDVVRDGNVIGLLGTPNGNPFDDWMTRSGETVALPSSRNDRLFEPAYNYCTSNWCITAEEDSLFTYEEGTTFSDFNECDAPFGNPPNFDDASPALRALCGEDSACLIDGLVGNIEDARSALISQAQDDEGEVTARPMRFRPPIVAVESTVNVLVTVDVRDRSSSALSGLESFDLFRVDNESGERQGVAIVRLFDDGSAVTSDEEADDLVFTNVIAVRSTVPGERQSFQAVPIINGSPDTTSDLVVTALNGIRSYSRVSNIGEVGEDRRVVTIESIDGLELFAEYTWPADQEDLDTGTEFADEKVGFQCGPLITEYMTFSGDDTTLGGSETVEIRLSAAREDGVWEDSVSVVFNAGWFEPPNRGPASLRMVLRPQGTESEIPNSGLSLPISPGVQDGCSTNLVATLSVDVAADGVTLTLSEPGNSA